MKTKFIQILTLASAFVFQVSFAQQTVSGTVFDESGQPLPGATVLVKGTSTATSADFDGNFTIPASEGETLIFSYVGYNPSEVLVDGSTINITLSSSTALDEVVVTGVSNGTDIKKLGFSIGKVGGESLSTVPGTDAANALRGKVAGVRIVQPSGNPSSNATIRLRGSTSVNGNQSPLILIDGVPSNGTRLSDIPVEDIESMEVVKGAAGSSIYGSLAGSGTVNIITKKGARNSAPQVTISYENSFSSLTGDYPTANKHMFKNDPQGVRMGDFDNDPTTPDTSNFGFLLDATGNRMQDVDDNGKTLFDNPYLSTMYDATAIYTSQASQTVTASVRGGGEKINYYLSFQDLEQNGILENVPSYDRTSFRANFNVDVTDKTSLNISSAIVNSDGFSLTEQGQGGDNAFYSALIAEPFINLNQKGSDGQYVSQPDGYLIQGSNFDNPNYFTEQITFGYSETRTIASAKLSHQLSDDFTFDFVTAIDKRDTQSIFAWPDGFETPTPDPETNDGAIYENASEYTLSTTNASLTYKTDISDKLHFATTANASYIKDAYQTLNAGGYDFIAKGVYNVENTLRENQTISSEKRESIFQSIGINTVFDYDDKLIFDALVRNDVSSFFGAKNRSRVFGRASLAYRLSEDVDLGSINEFKIRASRGSSGTQPSFYAQYETFSVSSSGISPGILGNNEILPSVVSETELGVNFQVNNNYTFEFTYSKTDVKDDVILVPLSGVAGYSSQYQNVGEISSTYLEGTVSGTVIDRGDLQLSFDFNIDTGTQEITNLGDVPPYTRAGLGAVDIFRVEEGKPYGTMYGYSYLTSMDQLTIENGVVMNNAASNALAGGQFSADDYSINEHGYVVKTSDIGTSSESPLVQYDSENGTDLVSEIGNTNPEFNIGFSANLKYKDFGFYLLLDYQNGGDIYNYTRQLMYYNDRHGDLVSYAALDKDINYAQNLYYQSSPNSHFVEDGSYMKIREVALSYDWDKPSSFIDSIGLKLSGINLLTVTNYTGWDPEVAINSNPTNFRLDEYSYPNFSTFLSTITIKF